MLKTCICCQKDFDNNENQSLYLGVCNQCTRWKNNHMSQINQHRQTMMDGFSSSVRAEFEKLTALEQGFLVLRSMELQAPSS